MVYVFLLKPFKQWNLKKFRLLCWLSISTKHYGFSRKAIQVYFPLDFCFASFPSLKALTGCLEKLEILAKRFGL